ncbi:MAG: crotonase [Halioglobus sp.]|nr:crotonase [Halioglobus sp.]
MDYTGITFVVEDGVAVITFDRAEAMNVMTGEMLEELGDAYRRCDEDDAVRAVVVTGAGKAFCAGMDMSGGGATFDSHDEVEFTSCPLSMQAWEVRKPVIAACNGHAVGVGLGIAAQCDLRVLAAEGKYGFVQNRRGVVADFAIEQLLPRLIGFERAFEMIVGGVRVTGETAGEWGLAKRVVPAAQVLDTAMELARDFAVNCSPLVMGLHKRLLWRAPDMGQQDYIDLETRALKYSMGRPDAIEGGMAYFEKRPPDWTASVSGEWPDWMDE